MQRFNLNAPSFVPSWYLQHAPELLAVPHPSWEAVHMAMAPQLAVAQTMQHMQPYMPVPAPGYSSAPYAEYPVYFSAYGAPAYGYEQWADEEAQAYAYY